MASGATAFSPASNATATLAVTATSGNVALPSVPADGSLKITNAGTKTMFVRLGTANTVAAVVPSGSAGDMPVLAGTSVVIDRGNTSWIAAICGGADTTTLYATAGQGGS
jgi:hypothetical protein